MKPTRQIRKFLKDQNKSQGWLARELNVSPAYVSQILNEHRRPSLNVATRIEALTGIAATAFAEVA